jgi:hypothetical protein
MKHVHLVHATKTSSIMRLAPPAEWHTLGINYVAAAAAASTSLATSAGLDMKLT